MHRRSVLAIALAGAFAASGCGAVGGFKTPRDAVDAFVQALGANDAQRLRAVINPDLDAEPEIRDQLARYGGRKIEVSDVDIVRNSVDAAAAEATVVGTADGLPYRQSLGLHTRVREGWFVNLGYARGKPRPTEPAPAAPRPSPGPRSGPRSR